MDQVLSRLALTGASFVGKAAFSYATQFALKRIHPSNLDGLWTELQLKLDIVSPTIDLVQLACARGNSSLEALLVLIDRLKESILSLKLTESPTETDLKRILAEIDSFVPILSLGMQVANVSFANRLDAGISPSQLLRASSILNASRHNVSAVGQYVYCTLYTLFEGSARKNSAGWTWKEEYPKCRVSLHRHSSKSIAYSLLIEQDMDDGMYHEEPLKRTRGFAAGRKLDLDVQSITKLFYTSSGRILNIEDATLPVLVLKVLLDSSIDKNSSEDPKLVTNWFALELYSDTDDPDSEGEEVPSENDKDGKADEEEAVDSLTQTVGKLSLAKSSTKNSPKPAKKDEQIKQSLNRLSVLEYLVRIASMEVFEQKPHTECSDEVICQYLQNDVCLDDAPLADTSTQKKKSVPPSDSPLATRYRTRLADRLLSE